jgi:hypothetical protein
MPAAGATSLAVIRVEASVGRAEAPAAPIAMTVAMTAPTATGRSSIHA